MEWRDPSSEVSKRLAESLPYYAAIAPLLVTQPIKLAGFDPAENYLCLRGATLDAVYPDQFRIGEDPLPTSTFTFIKRATLGEIGHRFGEAFNTAQSWLGGPNALTTTLVGGALGGLGGYALGKTLDHTLTPAMRALLPREYQHMIGQSKWAPLLGAAGLGAGMIPGAIRGHATLINGQDPWAEIIDPQYVKAASATGAMFVPTVPVDAFNRAVWSDAQPQNPFGTRSAFGDNEQPMRTPPNVAAAISGLVGATGAVKGSDTVSPWDIAQVAGNIAAGGIAGAATGLLAGKTIGALAGLSPEAQDYLKSTGLWAGVLTGLARTIF